MRSNVASFLTEGGRITKLTPIAVVTVCEPLGYLRTCGSAVKYAAENFNGYRCDGKTGQFSIAPCIWGIVIALHTSFYLSPYDVCFRGRV
jgi:hypothetical protein